MTTEVRACIFCHHANFQEPYAYESCSGGDEWTCDKKHFPNYDLRTIAMVDECAYQRALNCPDFVLAPRFAKRNPT